MNDISESEAAGRRASRLYGGLLLVSALLSMFVLAHHPITGAHDLAGMLRSLERQAAMIEAVHGSLILLFLIMLLGYCGFCRRLGLARPLVTAGLIAFCVGTFAMITAAMINGFAVPDFASAYQDPSPDRTAAVAATLRMSWALNQAMAGLGVIAWSAAILLWSAVLVRGPTWSRATGLFGMAAALAVAGALLGGWVTLEVGGFMAVVAVLTAWTLAAGALLATDRL
jgi:hypothetical protein